MDKFHYTVCGRLAGSYCSHMVLTTRERARRLLKNAARAKDQECFGRRGYMVFRLAVARPKELYKNYTYQDTLLYIGLN